MFLDEARIRIKAGDGGNGAMAFRREKFVPRGGPSGGDGGHGGDILMRSSLSHNTLIHFRYNPEWKSQRGGHGLGSNMSGFRGDATTLEVPVGTVVYDEDTGELVHDFTAPNEEIVIARGGRGGRGNQHFATSTHQAPREHELGRPGDERHLRLELRLLADAGLVGFPNVGKSTLISRLSAARPKIANYPFTTLEPNLGVVEVGDPPHNLSFTVADMPGLIQGAHLGAGLGTQFLRHIERTAILVHLVDVSDTALGATPDDDAPSAAQSDEERLSGLSFRAKRSVAEESAVDNARAEGTSPSSLSVCHSPNGEPASSSNDAAEPSPLDPEPSLWTPSLPPTPSKTSASSPTSSAAFPPRSPRNPPSSSPPSSTPPTPPSSKNSKTSPAAASSPSSPSPPSPAKASPPSNTPSPNA